VEWGDEVKVLRVPECDWKPKWGPYPWEQSLVGMALLVMLDIPKEGLTLLLIRRNHGDMDVVWPTKYLEPVVTTAPSISLN